MKKFFNFLKKLRGGICKNKSIFFFVFPLMAFIGTFFIWEGRSGNGEIYYYGFLELSNSWNFLFIWLLYYLIMFIVFGVIIPGIIFFRVEIVDIIKNKVILGTVLIIGIVLFIIQNNRLFYAVDYKNINQKIKNELSKEEWVDQKKEKREKEIIDKARENFLFISKNIKIIATTDYDFGFYIMYNAVKKNNFYIDGWRITPNDPCYGYGWVEDYDGFKDLYKKDEIISYFNGFNNGGFKINGASIPTWKHYSDYHYYNYDMNKEETVKILRVAQKLSKLDKEKFLKKLKNKKMIVWRPYHYILQLYFAIFLR